MESRFSRCSYVSKPLVFILNSFLLLSSINCSHDLEQAFEPKESPCSNLNPNIFVAFEKAPVAIKTVQPEYPEAARRAGLEGTVWLRTWIDKEGYVVKAEIHQSNAEIFNQPALHAIMQWEFTPAMQGGHPICVWVSIMMEFKL